MPSSANHPQNRKGRRIDPTPFPQTTVRRPTAQNLLGEVGNCRRPECTSLYNGHNGQKKGGRPPEGDRPPNTGGMPVPPLSHCCAVCPVSRLFSIEPPSTGVFDSTL